MIASAAEGADALAGMGKFTSLVIAYLAGMSQSTVSRAFRESTLVDGPAGTVVEPASTRGSSSRLLGYSW